MTETEYLRLLADYVALIYHEARTVRHLVREGLVGPEQWKYLVSLPVNRDHAWGELQETRRRARIARTPREALTPFEQRFRVSLPQLIEMYEHKSWRGSAYGGNAWASIAHLVREFAKLLDSGNLDAAQQILEQLARARHNTGFVRDKLVRLDNALIGSSS